MIDASKYQWRANPEFEVPLNTTARTYQSDEATVNSFDGCCRLGGDGDGDGDGVARASVSLSLTAGALQLAALRRVTNNPLEFIVWCSPALHRQICEAWHLQNSAPLLFASHPSPSRPPASPES